jgi:POT family proton-dependent oligopeptide transporter
MERNKQLTLLFFVRLLATLGYSTLFSTLALYLHYKGMSQLNAAQYVSGFIALNYIMPFIGGVITGKLISNKWLYIIGMLMTSMGFLMLSLGASTVIPLAIAMILMSGLVKSVTINVILANLTRNDESFGRRAFLYNYCGMNIGFFLGYLISGFFTLHSDFSHLFMVAFLFPLLSIVLVLFLVENNNDKKNTLPGTVCFLGLMVFLIILFDILFQHLELLHYLLVLFSAGGILTLLHVVFSEQENAIRKKLWVLIGFMIISVVYWTVSLLTPVALMFFIKSHVRLSIGKLHLAPQWLNGINPIILMCFTPIVAYIAKKLKDTNKRYISTDLIFSIAMFFVAGAGLLMYFELDYAHNLNVKISAISAIVYFTFISFGELFIGPEGFRLPGSLAPPRLLGLMSGAWLATLGIGSVCTSYLASFIYSRNPHTQILLQYKHTFGVIFISMLCMGFFLLYLGLRRRCW